MNRNPFYSSDPWLEPFKVLIESRINKCIAKEEILAVKDRLSEFALGHHYYGMHRTHEEWIFREWAPNAKKIYLTGTFTNWQERQEFLYKLNLLLTGG